MVTQVLLDDPFLLNLSTDGRHGTAGRKGSRWWWQAAEVGHWSRRVWCVYYNCKHNQPNSGESILAKDTVLQIGGGNVHTGMGWGHTGSEQAPPPLMDTQSHQRHACRKPETLFVGGS